MITTTSISLLKRLANLFTISACKCYVRYQLNRVLQRHSTPRVRISSFLKWLPTSLCVLSKPNLLYLSRWDCVNVFRSHCLRKCTGFSVSLVKNVIWVFISSTALYVFGQWVLRFAVIDLLVVLKNLLVPPPWSHIHLYVNY